MSPLYIGVEGILFCASLPLCTLGMKMAVPAFWLPKVRKGVPAKVVGFGGEGDL